MPRRTNTGATYANPNSALYQPDWMPYIDISVIGGVIMFIAVVVFIISFFATVFSRTVEEMEEVEFPISEPYHDEPALWLRNLKPWIITAVILIVISYTPVIYDVIRSTYGTSMPYNPASPIPERMPTETQMP